MRGARPQVQGGFGPTLAIPCRGQNSSPDGCARLPRTATEVRNSSFLNGLRMIRGGIGLADFRRLDMVPEPEGREALGRNKPASKILDRSAGGWMGRTSGSTRPRSLNQARKSKKHFIFRGSNADVRSSGRAWVRGASSMPRDFKLQGGRIVFFAYFGPETTLPLASVLAASLGFLMMMGRGSLRFAARFGRAAVRLGEKSRSKATSAPSRRAAGMRSDRPHRGGEVPGWVRAERPTASSSMVDRSRREDESSNG